MKYTFCISIEKTVSDKEMKDLKKQGKKKVAAIGHGPWRDSPAEVERDRELFLKDPKAFLKMVKSI
jgi:hypothetical protein